jgi:transposase
MAGKRIEIMDLRQLITLKKDGASNRKVGRLLQLSRNTVNGYVRLLEAQNMSYEALLTLSDATLKELCAPQSEKSLDRYEQLATHFDYFFAELKKPGCTLLTLWHEYQQKHPQGYAYTQFTRHYNRWSNARDASGKLTHKAGEKVFIDYTGKKLFYVDKTTGEQIPVEVFVGILPCSQYTFVEGSHSQKREDLIASMRRCLEYFGGVTQAIVPDNLKSAVTKASKYEAVINKTFKDFALHYGCVIDPTRPYSPNDKALVEGAVKLVYQRIFYPLSKMTFFSIAELNHAIGELLVKYNQCLFQQTQYSRKELFVSTEKNYLKPLPPTAYELRQYCRPKVQKMGYIFLSADKHYYSVPYRYIGKQVDVRYTPSIVEIFYNHERLCTHKRDYQAGKYTTLGDHLSSTHQFHSEWSLPFFQQKAKYIGSHTHDYITKLILQYSYPEIGYKQAMGIIHFTRLYDKGRIENACRIALAAPHCSYRILENMLKSGMDQLDLPLDDKNHIPPHDNIRGADNYQ